MFTLDAHQNAHQVEANWKRIECASIPFALVFKFVGNAHCT